MIFSDAGETYFQTKLFCDPCDVEASPEEGAQAWRTIFTRMRSAGFSAYAIENSYETDWYPKWKGVTPLRKLNEVSPRRQDFLFSRISRADGGAGLQLKK